MSSSRAWRLKSYRRLVAYTLIIIPVVFQGPPTVSPHVGRARDAQVCVWRSGDHGHHANIGALIVIPATGVRSQGFQP
jgi:hypothetical protein